MSLAHAPCKCSAQSLCFHVVLDSRCFRATSGIIQLEVLYFITMGGQVKGKKKNKPKRKNKRPNMGKLYSVHFAVNLQYVMLM